MHDHDRRSSPTRPPDVRRERARKERPVDDEDTPWRLFIAVPVPDDVRDLMTRIIEDLSREGWPVRWVDPGSGHLTLHFLGDTPPETATLLRLSLGDVVAVHERFDLRTADLGAFPKMKNPRVLWLGLWGPAHRLEAIYDDLGDFLDNFGFDIEERPFHPHLTLGRVRKVEQRELRAFIASLHEVFDRLAAEGLGSPNHAVPFPVDEVQLIRSHLSHDGARYEVIGSYRLE